MTKIKVREAEGKVLDALVAQVQGYTNLRRNVHRFDNDWILYPPGVEYGAVRLNDLDYSTNWGLTGPIIEREGITVGPHQGTLAKFVAWRNAGVGAHRNEFSNYGPTPLIAAMRCFVASRLGYEVEIPEELLK